MDTETITTEAPGTDSGADENSAKIPTTVEELASSFIERVEESPEPETPEAEASETAEAEEGSEEDVLLQSESEESETESEAEVEETEAEPPKGVGKLLKQVGKLTARAKSAEERVEAMGAEIANLKAQPNEQKAEPQNSPVLEEVANFDDLEKVRKEAIAAKKWAVQHLGKEYVEEGEKEYTGDEVREIFAAADEYLTEKIPQRAGFLQAKAESDARSREVFDFWDNPEDEANLLYQQVLAWLLYTTDAAHNPISGLLRCTSRTTNE